MKETIVLQTIFFNEASEWDSWLSKNCDSSKGIWIKLAKKATGIPSLSYPKALEIALCYGWIDGQKKSFDDKYWLQKFIPRSPKSVWSKINKENAEVLTKQGKMKPSGLRQIEAAKADGRWEKAYDSQKTITIPNDFQKELDKNKSAQDFFNSLNSANRYAILLRITMAKKPETRTSRIRKFLEMLSKKQKLYP